MAKISECKYRILKENRMFCLSPVRAREIGEILSFCPYSDSYDVSSCPYFEKGFLCVDVIEGAIFKYFYTHKLPLPSRHQIFELAVYINQQIILETRKSKIVYKIVEPFEGKLHSVIAKGKADVIYIPHTWIKPPKWLQEKGYYLTAFKDFKSAINWICDELLPPNLELWEAEASEVITELPPMLKTFDLGAGVIKEAKENWPKGTLMAKSLRLFRKIGDIGTLQKARKLFEDYFIDILKNKKEGDHDNQSIAL